MLIMKILTNIRTFFPLVICMVQVLILSSCDNNDPVLFYPSSEEVKERIFELSNKYDIPVEVTEKGETECSLNVDDLGQLEMMMSTMKEKLGKSVIVPIKLDESSDIKCYVSANASNNVEGLKMIPRLRSGSLEFGGVWSMEEWYYNYTYMNVNISGNKNQLDINSYFSGVSVWTYEQISSSYSIDETVVNFHIDGLGSTTLGFDKFGLHFNVNIDIDGYINTSTENGEMTINDYI